MGGVLSPSSRATKFPLEPRSLALLSAGPEVSRTDFYIFLVFSFWALSEFSLLGFFLSMILPPKFHDCTSDSPCGNFACLNVITVHILPAYRTPSPRHLPPLPILYHYLVLQPSNCPRLPPRVLLNSFPVGLYPRVEFFFCGLRPTFCTRDIFNNQEKKVVGRGFRES